MKIRIQSHGTGLNTAVTTEDGRDISSMISAISWRVVAGGLATATMDLILIDLCADVEARMLAPNGKEVARIVYADGSEDVFKS